MLICGVKTAFVQYFDNTDPVDEVNLALNCGHLRWATENETDHSTAYISMSADNVKIGEWYDLVLLSSKVSEIHIVRFNYTVKELAQQLRWRSHCFYDSRFYQTKT